MSWLRLSGYADAPRRPDEGQCETRTEAHGPSAPPAVILLRASSPRRGTPANKRECCNAVLDGTNIRFFGSCAPKWTGSFRPNPVIAHAQTGVRFGSEAGLGSVAGCLERDTLECGARHLRDQTLRRNPMFAGGAYLARCNSLAPFAARWGAAEGRLKGRDFLLGRRPMLQSGPCRVRSIALRNPTDQIRGMPKRGGFCL